MSVNKKNLTSACNLPLTLVKSCCNLSILSLCAWMVCSADPFSSRAKFSCWDFCCIMSSLMATACFREMLFWVRSERKEAVSSRSWEKIWTYIYMKWRLYVHNYRRKPPLPLSAFPHFVSVCISPPPPSSLSMQLHPFPSSLPFLSLHLPSPCLALSA